MRWKLLMHASKVRKYIVLHDTTTYGLYGEAPGHAGLWPAVKEFLKEGTFLPKERYGNSVRRPANHVVESSCVEDRTVSTSAPDSRPSRIGAGFRPSGRKYGLAPWERSGSRQL
jgi:hypothetical protein